MDRKQKRALGERHPLDRLVMWLRWPENKRTGIVPWFVIMWRIPWMALVYAGLAVAWLGVAMISGIHEAVCFWRDAL